MTTKVDRIIASKVQSVCEWDDRTSPDDYPEHLLITPDELKGLFEDIIEETAKAAIGNARMSILEEAYRLGFESSEEGDNGECGNYHNEGDWQSRRREELTAMCERLSLPLRAFDSGDRVTKIKGSSWTGRVVGFYSTELTPIGYCVESETETGSVQIYPEAALANDPLPNE